MFIWLRTIRVNDGARLRISGRRGLKGFFKAKKLQMIADADQCITITATITELVTLRGNKCGEI